MVRFVGLVARIPAYVRLGWALSNDPAVPRWSKAAVIGAVGYAVSPIDPLPGVIPVVGQLDDLAILLLALRGALASMPDDVGRRHLARFGLSHETLQRDLVTIRATTIWIAGRAGRVAARLGKMLARQVVRRLRLRNRQA